MVDFYINLLQAEPVHQTSNITFLRYDGEHHRIAIIHAPEYLAKTRGEHHAEVDHLAFTYANLTELAHTYLALKGRGQPILPVWSVNHGPTTSLYYRDPDGNKIELQVDNFDTPEEADAYMKGPLFAHNPIGTDIDVESWASQILGKVLGDGTEGLSPDEATAIKQRPEIGERFTLPDGFI